jgi:hypothetical protein
MSWSQKSAVAIMLVVAIALGIMIGTGLNTPVVAEGQQSSAGMSRYSVVKTEGVNLVVTDNQKDTVYFYTVDPGDKPGADLHLRGTIDLTQVGKATIKPTLLNPKK